MSTPTHKALFFHAFNKEAAIVKNVETPTPGPGEILVKIHATALNPVDWKAPKYGAFFDYWPATVGHDGAGEVVQLGEGVSNFTVGDKVFFAGSFESQKYATFQQYVVAVADIAAKIPENLNYEKAATIPAALITPFVGLYWKLKLTPLSVPEGLGKYNGVPFVILGGSSAIGQFAVQLAKLSGFSPIITTSSLKHTEYLKSLGATHVLDRNLPLSTLPSDVAIITSQPIQYIFDAVSEPETQQAGYDLLADGGEIVVVLPLAAVKKEGSNKVTHFMGAARSNVEQREFYEDAYRQWPGWLAKGWLKTLPFEVLPNGLAGIEAGLKRMERNEISGLKLVAHPWE